jgi:hypothetical protein
MNKLSEVFEAQILVLPLAQVFDVMKEVYTNNLKGPGKTFFVTPYLAHHCLGEHYYRLNDGKERDWRETANLEEALHNAQQEFEREAREFAFVLPERAKTEMIIVDFFQVGPFVQDVRDYLGGPGMGLLKKTPMVVVGPEDLNRALRVHTKIVHYINCEQQYSRDVIARLIGAFNTMERTSDGRAKEEFFQKAYAALAEADPCRGTSSLGFKTPGIVHGA